MIDTSSISAQMFMAVLDRPDLMLYETLAGKNKEQMRIKLKMVFNEFGPRLPIPTAEIAVGEPTEEDEIRLRKKYN